MFLLYFLINSLMFLCSYCISHKKGIYYNHKQNRTEAYSMYLKRKIDFFLDQ